jgi:hypothetical protein
MAGILIFLDPLIFKAWKGARNIKGGLRMEIRKFQVQIEGMEPGLLMHKFSEKGEEGKTKILPPEEYAKKAAYWSKDKSHLIIPAANIHRALIQVSTRYRAPTIGRITPFVAGSLDISPEEIPLQRPNGELIKDYEIDIRGVVIQGRGRIRRARPKIWPWKATFVVSYITVDFPADFPGTLEEMFNEAGRRIGLCDYRPAKGGPFGKFEVKEIVEIKEEKTSPKKKSSTKAR